MKCIRTTNLHTDHRCAFVLFTWNIISIYPKRWCVCCLCVLRSDSFYIIYVYRKHTAILISIEIILIKKYLCSCDWSGARQAKSMHTTVWRCCSLHQHPYCEIPIIINSFCIFFLFFSSITLAEYILKIDYIFFHACNTAPQHQQK